MRASGYVAVAVVIALACVGHARAERTYAFAGSIQLDYLAVPTDSDPRRTTLDGTTVELSMKLTADLTRSTSAAVKTCFACHGFEVGMAYVELRRSDELRLRVGRFTPELGAFPARHDPANHSTSDKPLPYDMGRMLRLREWNEGVLPTPWVDNGVEVIGTHFFDHGQIDYAAYLVSGPKGAADGEDFDFTLSRSPQAYYVDNNSKPVVGARVGATFEIGGGGSVAIGASAMTGTYDAAGNLRFAILGGDAALQVRDFAIRAEYIVRRTEMALGADPEARFKYGPAGGQFAGHFVKDGFYVEFERLIGRLAVIGRWDGLRRSGNVLVTSPLRAKSAVLRYTAAAAYRLRGSARIKASVEVYDFSDFSDEIALHLGLAMAF